ncbi:MAG: GAF domain-containing protein [Candidatus Wallbacteria bacterium]|nr:GAF domain-containing protein [Candidatus Wallbacteria bacterium]
MRPGHRKEDPPDPARASGSRPAVSPFPELRGPEEPPASSTPGTPRAGGAPRAAALDSQSNLDLSSELRKLREASPLVDGLQDSALKAAARFVLRNLGVQLALFTMLAIIAVLLPIVGQKAMGIRLEPGAFAYFIFFLVATILFTRHRYKESFIGLTVVFGVALLLHVFHLFPGFKPTLYFFATLLVVGILNAFYYNDFTVTIAEQNLELRTLRKEVLASDRLMGRVAVKGGTDEMAFVKRAQEEVAQTRAHYSSLIANLMQFAGSGEPERGRGTSYSAPNYTVIARACWQLLKRGIGASRAEMLFLDPQRNLLYTVRAFVSADKSPESPFGLAGAPSEEIAADKAKMTISLEKDSLFKACVTGRRMLFRNDIDREAPLRELEAKTPCPVHSLIPLLDGDTVLGVLNMSECPKKELSDEDKTILRTTARLAAMALAHAQTFLQTKEELEQAKVLSGEERKKRAEVMKIFKTLVSANIVEEILNDPSVMNPKRQRITIIFVDLRGFTTLSERLDAALVVELLDDFFETLTPLIFKYGGTLDKYIGDEIMALWGAPFAKPDDTRNAILCSVEMMQAMDGVKTRWKKKKNLDVAMGIAINTGEAIVGSIGSSANKNFTAIGDAVNTCARLEGLSEANQILMTRATFDDVRDIVKVRQLPSQHVKGKEIQLEIYEVLGLNLDGAREISLPAYDLAALAPAATPAGSSKPGAVRAAGPMQKPDRASAPSPAAPAPGADGPARSPAPYTAEPGLPGSKPGAVRTPPARTSRPLAVPPDFATLPEPEPAAAADVTIGSSRELASRVSDSARQAIQRDAAANPSSRELAARAGGGRPGQPASDPACPRCRHANRQSGLKRCEKCGETLERS